MHPWRRAAAPTGGQGRGPQVAWARGRGVGSGPAKARPPAPRTGPGNGRRWLRGLLTRLRKGRGAGGRGAQPAARQGPGTSSGREPPPQRWRETAGEGPSVPGGTPSSALSELPGARCLTGPSAGSREFPPRELITLHSGVQKAREKAVDRPPCAWPFRPSLLPPRVRHPPLGDCSAQRGPPWSVWTAAPGTASTLGPECLM